MSEQDEVGDEASPFDFQSVGISTNWMLDLFRDAVRARNYPVIGLGMALFGSMMKMMNSDFPIFVTKMDLLTTGSGAGGGYTGGLLGDWLRQKLGTPRYLTEEERTIRVNLSDVLILSGFGLLGADIAGKLIPG